MWRSEEISLFFSLFELNKNLLESLSSKQLTKEMMDGMGIQDFHDLLKIDEGQARVVHLLWNEICSFRHCAQDALHRSKETLNLWRQYFQKSTPVKVTTPLETAANRICPALRPLESVPDSLSAHFIELKALIEEQKERIQTLEMRELDCQDELKRREKLILDLHNQMASLHDDCDSRTNQLKLFADVADETHSRLLEEIEKLHDLLRQSTKATASLHQVFQESNEITDQMSLDSFNPLDLSSTSNLPILMLKKLSWQKFPLPSTTPLSSINPYIVISLRDGSIQTGSLAGLRSGATIEWVPNQLSQINTNILIDDTITVEIWNQFTIHEAHLVARAEGKVIPPEYANDWQNGKDCDCEIELNFVDENSQALDGSVLLSCKLKNNLYRDSERMPTSAAISTSPPQSQPLNEEQVLEYLRSCEMSLANLMPTTTPEVDSYLDSWKLLMRSLVLAQYECSNAISSSESLVHTQSNFSQNLLNSIKLCNTQSDGMREYALSLYPLVEKLRTEKSYMDLLRESESKYEITINTLKQNCQDLEENWKAKYLELETSSKLRYDELAASSQLRYDELAASSQLRYDELEASSQLRFDQYVAESQSRYTTLLESSNKAYSDLRDAYEIARAEVASLKDQLSESFSRYEKLKLNYEEVCRRLDMEMQELAAAKSKISSLETELEEIIEIVRKDMAQRCISKNAAEDLLTLFSQMISKDPNPNASLDIFLHQFDWQSIPHQLSVNMTESQVAELKHTLSSIRSSYDILCSRLFLECQARVELEKILAGTKEDLENIKAQVFSEVKIRKQLEEELNFAKELASNESKFALVAKKAAEDAIKQARYFQRKLNREIDHIRENISGTDVIGDISLTLPEDASELIDDGPAIPFSPPNKKSVRPKSAGSNRISSLEDDFYANLVLTPDGKMKKRSDSGSISQRSRGGKPIEMENSPYSEHLSPRSRKLIQRGEYFTQNGNRSMNSAPGSRKPYPHPNNGGLQTSSESGVDSRKRGKKVSSFGKKMMKKVQKSLGGRSKSNSTVAPFDDFEKGKATESGKPSWVDPNTKDYSSSKGKLL